MCSVPIGLLYVTVDPALVDVNVHPAKAELRFQYAQEVQNALVYAIREALRDGTWASANPPVKTVDSSPEDFDLYLPQRPDEDEVKRTVMRFDANAPAPARAISRVQPSLDFTKDSSQTAASRGGALRSAATTHAEVAEARAKPEIADAARSSERTLLGARATPVSADSAGLPQSSKAQTARDSNTAASRSAASAHADTAELSSVSTTGPAASESSRAANAAISSELAFSRHIPVNAGTSQSASMGPTTTLMAATRSLSDVQNAESLRPTSSNESVSDARSGSDLARASSSAPSIAPKASTELRSGADPAAMQARTTSAVSRLKASVPSPDGQTTIPWHDLQYIGPFARCFLLFEYQQQMLAIDQHAFHERVLYERLVENPDILRRTQPLLMPDVLVFSPTECERLVHMKDALDALGIQIQGVSDTEIEVISVPSLLVNKDLNSLLAAILGGRDKASELAHDVLATMACHAAVRAGEELPEPELKALLREAESVDFYHNCPHGRRVFRWWKLAQVAAWFDR